MKHFYIHVRSWAVFALTQHGYNKKDAIKRFKKQHNLAQMPNGYAIWEANA